MFDSVIHSFGNMIKCMKKKNYIYTYVKREIKKAKRENKEMEHKKSMGFGLRGQHPPQKVIDDFIFIIKL